MVEFSRRFFISGVFSLLLFFVLLFVAKPAIAAEAGGSCSLQNEWAWQCTSNAGSCGGGECIGYNLQCDNGVWVDRSNGSGVCTDQCGTCSAPAATNTPVPTSCGNLPASYPQCGTAGGSCDNLGASISIPYSQKLIVRPYFYDSQCNIRYNCDKVDAGPGECGRAGATSTPTIPAGSTSTPSPAGGTCIVSWEIPSSPAANSNITIKVKGVSGSTWQNVWMKVDGANKTLKTIESGPTFVYENINTGAAGSTHSLAFGTNNGSVTCGNASFTTGGGGTGTCPADSNLSIEPASPNVGDTVTFKYKAGEDVYIGGDTWSGPVSGCTLSSDLAARKYTCKADSAGSGIWKHYWNDKANCGSLSYTISSNGSSPTPTPTPVNGPTSTPTPTPTPPSVTTHFRVSESRFGRGDEGVNAPQWMEFKDEDGGDPVTISYKFANAKAGDELTLFVQYKNDKEKTEVYPKTIKYIGPNPVITSASCSYDPSGEGTLVTLIGSNFGGHDEQGAGGVKINGQQADIISWVPEEPVPTVEPSPTPTPVVCGGIAGKTCPTGFKCEIPDKTIPDASGKCVPEKDKNDDKVCAQVITSAKNPDGTQCKDFPTPCDVPSGWVKVANCSGVGSGTVLGGEASQSRVIAKIKDKMPGKVRIPLLLTLDDGRVALTSSNGTPTCTVNTTTVQFAAKVGCRSSGNFSLSDVNVNITELVSGAKPSVKQKLSLDKDGNLPSDFIPLLEKGKKYKLVVKAPKTVARKIEFTPAEGSNILPEVSLPIGDIAPAGNPDGKINVSDRSQIVREWSSANDTAKAGDLNLDGRVNSLDWSCMRENFNKEDEDKIQ